MEIWPTNLNQKQSMDVLGASAWIPINIWCAAVKLKYEAIYFIRRSMCLRSESFGILINIYYIYELCYKDPVVRMMTASVVIMHDNHISRWWPSVQFWWVIQHFENFCITLINDCFLELFQYQMNCYDLCMDLLETHWTKANALLLTSFLQFQKSAQKFLWSALQTWYKQHRNWNVKITPPKNICSKLRENGIIFLAHIL